MTFNSDGTRPSGTFTVKINSLPGRVILDENRHLTVEQAGVVVFSGTLRTGKTIIRDLEISDLDGDGTDELILAVIEDAAAGGVIIFHWNTEVSRYQPLTGFIQPEYYPFLARAGDIDNDGETEIVVGLFAPSLQQEQGDMMKLHIFNYRRTGLVPQWFSERWYHDFRIVNIEDKWRLLESQELDGNWRVNIFTWGNFGFKLDRRILIDQGPVRLDAVENRFGEMKPDRSGTDGER